MAIACALAGVLPASGAAQDEEAAVRLAMVAAVRARMGTTAAVRLEEVRIERDAAAVRDGGLATAGLVAVPEPGSRVGQAMRFALTAPGTSGGRPAMRRVGQAVAEVHVAVEHARAARSVARGETLGPADVEAGQDEIGIAPLAPVPVRADAIGSRAVRDLVPGDVLTPALVRAAPLVKSGETVRVVVRIGAVEAVGSAVAQQSGLRNARIRLINPESRRSMTGRVTGAGEVEVIHER